MIEFILAPWPWYFSGIMIALVMIMLFYFGRTFGFSSNFRTICAACGAGNHSNFFDFDWKSQKWNLLFLLGSIIGGYLASNYLSSNQPLALAETTIHDLNQLGIVFDGRLNPTGIFSLDFLLTVKGFLTLLGGGFLVGFGSRYAGGCTSGHAITGLSNLQLPSLIAVIGFFIGGLLMTHFIYPLIF
ncbi:MAG: YeeE/YedE family protein [Sphingobacteriaceae bacterium]